MKIIYESMICISFGLSIGMFIGNMAHRNEIKNILVQESLDIQESRDRENKLAEYLKDLDYEVSVLAGKNK